MGFDELVGGIWVGVRTIELRRKPGAAWAGSGACAGVSCAAAGCGCATGWAFGLLEVGRDLPMGCCGL